MRRRPDQPSCFHIYLYSVAFCNQTTPTSLPFYNPVTPTKLGVGQTQNYSCLSTHKFAGSPGLSQVTVRCEDDGSLTLPTFPSCVEIMCTLPPLLTGLNDMEYINPPPTPMRPGESVG